MNSITEQELHPSLKLKVDKIDQLEKNQTDNKDLEQIKKDIDSLKSYVDNGKNSLYSAIVGKKVTPKSKEFNSLVQGVNSIQTENVEQNKRYESQIQQLTTEKSQLQNQIKSIKPAKGNAQINDVIEGKTFTNDSGSILTGNIKINENIKIFPKYDDIIIQKGYYNNGLINGIKKLSDTELNEIISKMIKEDHRYDILKSSLQNNHDDKLIKLIYDMNIVKTLINLGYSLNPEELIEYLKSFIYNHNTSKSKSIFFDAKTYYNADKESETICLDFKPKILIVYGNIKNEIYKLDNLSDNTRIFESYRSDTTFVYVSTSHINENKLIFYWGCSGFGKCSSPEFRIGIFENDE